MVRIWETSRLLLTRPPELCNYEVQRFLVVFFLLPWNMVYVLGWSSRWTLLTCVCSPRVFAAWHPARVVCTCRGWSLYSFHSNVSGDIGACERLYFLLVTRFFQLPGICKVKKLWIGEINGCQRKIIIGTLHDRYLALSIYFISLLLFHVPV